MRRIASRRTRVLKENAAIDTGDDQKSDTTAEQSAAINPIVSTHAPRSPKGAVPTLSTQFSRECWNLAPVATSANTLAGAPANSRFLRPPHPRPMLRHRHRQRHREAESGRERAERAEVALDDLEADIRQGRERRERAVGDRDDRRPRLARAPGEVDRERRIGGEADRDQRVPGAGAGHLLRPEAADIVDQADGQAELPERVSQIMRDA